MLFPVEHHVKFCADPADIIEQHRIEPKRSRGGDIHGAVVKEDTLARIQAVAVQENPENWFKIPLLRVISPFFVKTIPVLIT